MTTLLNDIKFGFRQLRRSPGFTAVAVLTLALGIGATTAIFSVVNSVLLNPLPYPRPDRLVAITEYRADSDQPRFDGSYVAPAHYFEWRNSATAFQALGASRIGSANLEAENEPQRLAFARVTASYWDVFGLRPVFGRVFTAEEDQPGADDVIVLGYGFWLRQFGGAPDVVGRTLRLNGRAVTIIGVMGPELPSVDAYGPMAFSESERQDRSNHSYFVHGRLKPGVTLEQAQNEMTVIASRIAREFPNERPWKAHARSLLEVMVGSQRSPLVTLLAAVGGLFLIACVNVANLQIARASSRWREVSVRAALGAAPSRILRQLLTESVVLAVCGGALGLGFGLAGVQALVALAPPGLPRLAETEFNAPVYLAAAAITAVCGLACGLMPAIAATRVRLADTLKGARGGTESVSSGRLRDALVVSETALALLLLIGAGLLMRSFVNLNRVDPGFEPRNAVTFGIDLTQARYPTAEQRITFVSELCRRIANLNGVGAVGATESLPFVDSTGLRIAVEGRVYEAGARPSARYSAVTPDYFRAMGISVLRGRSFTEHDGQAAPPVAIVSQSFAARHFPNEDPLGKRISMSTRPEAWREIVGVVGDVKDRLLGPDSPEQMYEPFAQFPWRSFSVVVRSHGPVSALSAALKGEVFVIDKSQPVYRIGPLDQTVSASLARQRFATTLLAAFSVVAVVLAMIGLYGVMSYVVGQRRVEFGVRFALGAAPRDVLRLVLGRGARLVVIGLLLGCGAALVSSRLIASQLYGVSAHNPLVYGSLAIAFALTGMLACWLPARRAAKIDPMEALRYE